MLRFPKDAPQEFAVFRKLDTPAKIQGFLNGLPFNFDQKHRTCRSPLLTLRQGTAHCMEGALLAAAILWSHGEPPLLLDLKTVPKKDDDHVVALFRRGGRWGAISKTNHAVLRYRDPVYATPRELAMSYFNEYFLDNGKKTLRSFSAPFDLRRFGAGWLTDPAHQWDLAWDLDRSKHSPVAPASQLRRLRPADLIEIEAGKLSEWHRPGAGRRNS